MNNIILDMGYNLNVITNKTWEMMCIPKLIWSPIQLRLANQHNIVLIETMTGVNVNIDRV
jgi:hypothetical protein